MRSAATLLVVCLGLALSADATTPGTTSGTTISDPWDGAVWHLEVDRSHPAGPAHWVCLEAAHAASVRGSAVQATGHTAASSNQSAASSIPVIRAGQTIVVEQRTPALTARFRAVALESAAAGSPLRVRLLPATSGVGRWGAVIEVEARGEGLAEWSRAGSALDGPAGVHP